MMVWEARLSMARSRRWWVEPMRFAPGILMGSDRELYTAMSMKTLRGPFMP